MAASPSFASIPRVAVGSVSAANTSRTGSGTIVDIFTAGSSGSKINEVDVKSTGQPADSVVTLFLNDGVNATYWLFDEIDLGAPSAGSNTAASFRAAVRYDNVILPAGWKLSAAVTVLPTSGVLNVFVFAGDL